MAAQTDDLLTVEQAAAYLGVTVGTMHNLRSRGVGPLSWLEGRRLRYPRSGLDAHRARQREASTRGGHLVST
jgi:excisionase family DNA binding protein